MITFPLCSNYNYDVQHVPLREILDSIPRTSQLLHLSQWYFTVITLLSVLISS